MSEWDAFPVADQKPSALDGRSRELAIRTVLGEAANEPDEGMAGVAAVIRNRVQAGRYGGSDVPRVVTAKSQFEPWGTEDGRKRMYGYAPDSEAYRRAAAQVDRVFGENYDPTNGATHFYSPSAQAALGRQAPTWAANQEPQNIGRHSFYAPEGRVRSTDMSAQARDPWAAFPAATTTSPQPTSPPAEAAPTAEPGGRFTDNLGQNFRVAREGVSEAAPPKTGAGEALARGAATGVTANFYDELRGLMEAGGLDPKDPASLGSLLKGAYSYWTGDKEAEKKYNEATTREREITQRAETDQPVASIVGNIAGGVAIPLGVAARGATLGERTIQGARVGAAIGGLSGAGAGDDAASRLTQGATGAAIGTGVGAAAPGVVEGVIRAGQGIAAAARPVTTAIRGAVNPEGEAARRVTTALQRDAQAGGGGLTPTEFATSRAAGGPAAIMDMGGETTRALARSAANTSPEGRAVLNNAINNRFESQSDRVTGWLNRTFGPSDTGATREALQDAARRANRPAYARAYNDRAAQSLWDEGFEQVAQAPVVQDAIRGATRTGANRSAAEGWTPVRNPFRQDDASGRMVLADPNVRPNLQFWDHVKRNLDDTVTKLQRQGENSAARDAIQLRSYLVNHLDELVPSFGQARAGAARFFGANDALEAGERFLTSNAPINDARRAFGQMSAPERDLFREGFVQSLVQRIESTGDRRSVLNAIAQSPRAQQQIELAMGPQRAREFESMMRVEGVMDFARSAVQGNSTTARQLTELGLAGGAYGVGSGGDIMNPNGSALVTAALVWGAARGKGAIDRRVAQRVADMLVSNDPGVLRRGINIVARNQNMLNALRTFDASLARTGSQQAAPLQLQAAQIGRGDEDQPNVPRVPGQ
jgi:hypothetical protein